ncbi:Asp-tRNA(Asn)/Glu-tRNA(Gln) amidotransferase subunit GatB [candidate division KSB1 bacterium]
MRCVPSIGLEVHVQLKTASKIFCSCSVTFGGGSNTQVCQVCLGLPGVLPVVNRKAVDLALKAACAFGCEINRVSLFARKNYFYPDLPKGYQISQFEEPLAEHGCLLIPSNGNFKKIGITRIHLEEDAGKLMHPGSDSAVNESRIDINRCGTPLIEIVSEPDLASPAEAHEYLSRLKQILLYLGVSDCNMDEGSLRCDANVSVRPKESDTLGTKTELKNLNSFRFVEKALTFEIRRQQDILKRGEKVLQQTLAWDESSNSAVVMRTKEGSDDYRYFPEPDLIPLEIDQRRIEKIKASLPELPQKKFDRFIEQYGITPNTTEILTSSRELADYYEEIIKSGVDSVRAANWLLSEVLSILNEQKITISDFPVTPEGIGELLRFVEQETISGKIAKNVFSEMVGSGESAASIIKRQGLEQITDDTALATAVDQVLRDHENDVQAYLGGKEKVFGFFVGQVMKATRGKANPGVVNRILKDKLNAKKT